MAKLKAAQRDALQPAEFGLPGERKYPVNDKQHAALAKGRATQQYEKGQLSSGKKAAIDAKANRVIGHTFHSHKGTK